jgi:hypothetical protein
LPDLHRYDSAKTRRPMPYPLECPESPSGPEWESYIVEVVSSPVPAHLLTDEELRLAVKAQQTALAKISQEMDVHHHELASRHRIADDLSGQQKNLEFIKLLAEHHSRQQDRQLEAYRTASAVEAVKTMCDTVLEYSKNHRGEDYTHMAVKSIAQSTARILTSTTPSPTPPPPDIEDRVKLALSQGLKWNSNNTRPAKQSTVLKKIEEWERGYKLAQTISESEALKLLSLSCKSIESSHGKAFLIGLCDSLEAALNMSQASLPPYTRFKRIVEAYRGKKIPVEGFCKTICIEMYGKEVDEVIQILNDRIGRIGGIQNLTPELLRKTCTVKRLPVFIEWEEKDKTPIERFNSLKRGEYDNLYQALIPKTF